MTALIVIGLVLLMVAGAVLWRARGLARLTSRIEEDSIEPRSTFPTIVVLPAHHIRTQLVTSEARLDWLTTAPGARGELGLTERELVLNDGSRDLVRIPMKRIIDAAFIRESDGKVAGDRLSLLRVVWQRGGEQLATTFGLEVPWSAAEKLRRELHLRIVLNP